MNYIFRTNLDELPEVTTHIRWCRQNLGVRGNDWDFHGAKRPVILIRNSQLATFYKLKFPNHESLRGDSLY